MLLVDYPTIVQKYSSFFEHVFSERDYAHFKKAVSGYIVSENKTVTGLHRLFVLEGEDSTSFNRFFNNQNFDLEELNARRLSFLQSNPSTRFKSGKKEGVLSIDNSLLTHYGKHFDGIYVLKDYVNGGYKWSHDYVSLHYNDDLCDYPVYDKLWDAPDWEGVANFFMDKGFTINKDKWLNRHKEGQKWRNYIRSRYKKGRKKYDEVKAIYKTKIDIAEDLLDKFCKDYPDHKPPISIDTGFTSAQFCGAIVQKGFDYVGNLRAEQKIITAKSGEITLAEFLQKLRLENKEGTNTIFQKVGYHYKGEKQIAYAYFANQKIKGFDKNQRLVIFFHKEDLSDPPHFVISNRLDWYPSGILRIRRHRWPVETYHQEAKAEGLGKYQVRNEKAIQTHLALVVVAYSMLQYARHDKALLSKIQQKLQTEIGTTLPFLRRLMKADGFYNVVEYIYHSIKQGVSFQTVFKPFARNIAYT